MGFRKPISPLLDLLLQPVHSGWILRVVPHGMSPAELGNPSLLDYAELATPPYQSITPLSVSTDFAFRAQDAIGWNPRRFRFAPTTVVYQGLLAGYQRFLAEKGAARAQRERELAALVAQSPEGLFTILDSKLVPGAADQWAGAAAVSAAFTETAHTLDLPAEGQATPLGKILALRFRIQLYLPQGFAAAAGAKTVPPCLRHGNDNPSACRRISSLVRG